ncbi:uncharacterized protein M6B38_374055 [Iris pallida]|uniref:Uncharacterized protein n=1 Tax=Iris pallida TaxID=29817 RepID=A0AAX6GC18_IRIPA|nr:uncharacterized protein M6B38_374055 [Iris pallida]
MSTSSNTPSGIPSTTTKHLPYHRQHHHVRPLDFGHRRPVPVSTIIPCHLHDSADTVPKSTERKGEGKLSPGPSSHRVAEALSAPILRTGTTDGNPDFPQPTLCIEPPLLLEPPPSPVASTTHVTAVPRPASSSRRRRFTAGLPSHGRALRALGAAVSPRWPRIRRPLPRIRRRPSSVVARPAWKPHLRRLFPPSSGEAPPAAPVRRLPQNPERRPPLAPRKLRPDRRAPNPPADRRRPPSVIIIICIIIIIDLTEQRTTPVDNVVGILTEEELLCDPYYGDTAEDQALSYEDLPAGKLV